VPIDAGLCETCRHSRTIVSDRGSVFYLCQLSFHDPRFWKYPALPVLECSGYAVKAVAESLAGPD
jgi:hypothetical protein